MKTLLHKSILCFVLFIILEVSVVSEGLAQISSNPMTIPIGGTVSQSGDSLSSLLLYSVTYKKDTKTLGHTDLSSNSGSGNTMLNLDGTPMEQKCFCTCINKLVLRIDFDDYGDAEDYRHAGTDVTPGWTSAIILHIPLPNGKGDLDFTLNIDQHNPQQIYEEDITRALTVDQKCSNTGYTPFALPVYWDAYNPPDPEDVYPDIKLRIKLISEMDVKISSPECTSTLGYKILLTKLTTSNTSDGNPLQLEWDVKPVGTGSCADKPYIPNYQVQILKLSNRDGNLAYSNDENKVKDTINWRNALSFETFGPLSALNLTLAEGSGFYVWRVRPIMNGKYGGIGNDLNWGEWSKPDPLNTADGPELLDGDIVEIERDISDNSKLYSGISSLIVNRPSSSTTIVTNLEKRSLVDVFFYRQFDEERNWIFSRTFTEGSTKYGPQFNEKMLYANRLLQPTQQQIALKSKDSILISYTGYDFAGRPVLKSLPASIPSQSLSYIKSILTQNGGSSTLLYSASDFDNTNTSGAITTNDAKGPIADYYSSNNPEGTIPSSEGIGADAGKFYPFTRTVYDSDPLGRVTEQSGVGGMFKIGSNKTIRTQYTSTPENELLSIFGDEAPRNTSTFKTVITDPNGIISVAYTTADGKTVATCLVKNDLPNESSLMELPLSTAADYGEKVNSINVIDTALGNMKIVDGKYYSYATFIVSRTTPCSVKYKITRNKVQSTCPALCKYCDYEVELKLTKLDPSSSNTVVYAHTETLHADECTPDLGTENPVPEYNLPSSLEPGKYLLTRTITSNTIVETNGVKKTTLDSYIDNLNSDLTATIPPALRKIFGSKIDDHLSHAEVTPPTADEDDYYADRYETILKNYRTFRGSGTTDPLVNLMPAVGTSPAKTTCYEIELEQISDNCPSPCTDATFDVNKFEDFLKTTMNTTSIASSFQQYRIKASTTTDREVEIDPLAMMVGNVPTIFIQKDLLTIDAGHPGGNGQFNEIINHMYNNGTGEYTCSKLWRCWKASVEALKVAKGATFTFPKYEHQNHPEGSPEAEMDEAMLENDADKTVTINEFDLLETFLDCTGRKLCRLATNFDEYLDYPYKYIRPDGQYTGLYNSCVLDLFGTPAVPTILACTGVPAVDEQAHNNLELVWQCMKSKVGEAVSEFKENQAGSVEKKMKDKSIADETNDLPACCHLLVPQTNPATPYDAHCCGQYMEDKANEPCIKECDNEAATARKSIKEQYLAHQSLFRDEEYTISGLTFIAGGAWPVGLPSIVLTYDILPALTLDCMANKARDYCMSQCKLTAVIKFKDGHDYIETIGTPQEIQNRQKVFSNTLDTKVKSFEPQGTCTGDPSGNPKLIEWIVYTLNNYIEKIRAKITHEPGEWFDINPFLQLLKQSIPSINTTCRDNNTFKDEASFIFIDKAIPGKGQNKFFSYTEMVGLNQVCKVAFSFNKKNFDINKGKILLDMVALQKKVDEGRWNMDYNKYIDNNLSFTLNSYLINTWASSGQLYRDLELRKPSDSCTSTVEFMSNSICANDAPIRANLTDPHLTSWFYKWNYTNPPTTPYRTLYDSLDNEDNTLYRWAIPCLNAKEHPVALSEIVSYFSTLDYAFKTKQDGQELFRKWLLENEDYYHFNGIPMHNPTPDWNVFDMFNSHAYLGKIGVRLTDPYIPTSISTFEMWMDNLACAPSFGSFFRLHLLQSGMPERTYNIPYPSAAFDKLVYKGYPDPGGCRNINFNGENDYFFDVVGGFYIDDNGYLAFDDRQAGATSQTVADFVFSNIRMNCVNGNCSKDVIDAFCVPCNGVSECPELCFKWVSPAFTGKPTRLRVRSCEEQEVERLLQAALSKIGQKHKEAIATLREEYTNKCMKAESIVDAFTAKYGQQYYHYTLYYYDRAGRLVKTIPPKGVVPLLPPDPTNNPTHYIRKSTDHHFATMYKYNTLGQMTWQSTPDGGETNFWYDKKGRLRLSQNAKQYAETAYSYTNYDQLGRIIAVGENSDYPTQELADYSWPDVYPIAANTDEYTETYYTNPPTGGLPGVFHAPYGTMKRTQHYLQNRVSWTKTKQKGVPGVGSDISYTYYSYDPHGNVEWLIHDIPGMGATCIDYEYDLISGKVTKVSYQQDFKDQYFHRFGYDQDNRITYVETSKDQTIWERDAAYDYYLHGPLRRVVTGRDLVQGIDFIYTIQGWLKAINHPRLSADGSVETGDPGYDGYGTGSTASKVGLDAFGSTLTYFPGDFIHNNSPFQSGGSAASAVKPPINSQYNRDLYNGNIAGWVTGYRNQAGEPTKPLAGIYRYDVLNRLREDEPQKWTTTTGTEGSWSIAGYFSDYNYDPNGNIMMLDRSNKNDASVFDEMTYHYETGKNRLTHITDAAGAGEVDYDIDNQSSGNYDYDAIGNLIKDDQANITNISWTAAGKVSYVEKTNGTIISFMYDGMGNRIRKFVDKTSGDDETTWYIRDASGNVMSTYKQTGTVTDPIKQIEVPLYGTERIGIAKPVPTVYNNNVLFHTEDHKFTRTLGNKQYELKDHLGNVRVVVNDKKIENTNGTYAPVIESYSGYYPFGMQMHEDTWESPLYRYGYGGHEKDDEIVGEGNNLSFGEYGYDPRTARRWNIEPMIQKYPGLSGYSTFSDNPILFQDPNGKFFITDHVRMDYNAAIKVYGALKALEMLPDLIKYSLKREVKEGMKPGYKSYLHLDNMCHADMKYSLEHNGYGEWDRHQLQDFYSHSNYREILVAGGFYKDNQRLPLFDELESVNPEAYKAVMENIRTTDYDQGKDSPYDHDEGVNVIGSDEGIVGFKAKDDYWADPKGYTQTFDLSSRATVKKMQQEKAAEDSKSSGAQKGSEPPKK